MCTERGAGRAEAQTALRYTPRARSGRCRHGQRGRSRSWTGAAGTGRPATHVAAVTVGRVASQMPSCVRELPDRGARISRDCRSHGNYGKHGAEVRDQGSRPLRRALRGARGMGMKYPTARDEQAAYWYLKLQEPDVSAEEIDAALEWQADPENSAAFQRVEAFGQAWARQRQVAREVSPRPEWRDGSLVAASSVVRGGTTRRILAAASVVIAAVGGWF